MASQAPMAGESEHGVEDSTKKRKREQEDEKFRRTALKAVEDAKEEIIRAATTKLDEALQLLAVGDLSTLAGSALKCLQEMPSAPLDAVESVKAAERAVRDLVVIRCRHAAEDQTNRMEFLAKAEHAIGDDWSIETSAQLLLAYRKVAENEKWKDTESFPSNNKKAAERRGHVRLRRRPPAPKDEYDLCARRDPQWAPKHLAGIRQMTSANKAPGPLTIPDAQKIVPSDRLLQPVLTLQQYCDEEEAQMMANAVPWRPFDSQWSGYRDDEDNVQGDNASQAPALPTGVARTLLQMTDDSLRSNI